MGRLFIISIISSACMLSQASATSLPNLHKAVRLKVERYCPETLAKEDIDTLRKDEIVKLDEIDFFAQENRSVPQIEEETLTLCSGKYSQNRSNPGRVDCSFCREGSLNRPVLSINMHITKEVNELMAKRDAVEETSEAEIAQGTEIHG